MDGNSTLECVFFFFQAEDGIRDYKVTGVQTCALPISARPRATGAGDLVLLSLCRRARMGSGQHAPIGPTRANRDRKSVVGGKRVDLGGRRIIKKKKKRDIENIKQIEKILK